jgi:3-oxoacyl-[acyl-carrier protein] reductase
MVSGGSRGLGQSIVTALLDAGYRVSATSRKPTSFTQGLAGNPQFLFEPSDVADSASLSGFVDGAEGRFGPCFGLVNCAGVALDGVLATMTDERIDQLLSVNLAGTLRLTRRVVRRMLVANAGGSIINISSIVGLRGYSGLAAYGATKAGLDAITRALARELGGRRIRVNSIAPGYLETEMTRELGSEQRDQIVRRTPLGRLGTPADVTGSVLFLLSDAAAFMTGQVLVIDGGITS